MNIPKILITILAFFALIFLGSFSNTEYYNKGYKQGYSKGVSAVKDLRRVTDKSEQKYITSDVMHYISAETVYEMMTDSPTWNLDEEYEPEYKSGFIKGYNDGIEDELRGTKRTGDSSTTYGSGSQGNGMSFWQWVIVLVIIVPIVSWLGFGADSSDDTKSEEVNSQEPTLVNPWKSLLLVLFVFVFNIMITGIFDLGEKDWSIYIVEIISLMLLYSANENAKNWKKYNGAAFFCGLVRVLSVILSLMVVLLLIVNLYSRFC